MTRIRRTVRRGIPTWPVLASTAGTDGPSGVSER